MSDQKKKEKSNEKPIQMGFFYRFFSWCSGARIYILKECPSEYNKFLGIGMVVFMTGVMASITGSYALFTVFQNFYLAGIFGLLWGFLIFALDWYIVASLKKEEVIRKEIVSAAPRIILAILIAFVISKPLELKLFEKEIDKELARMNALQANDYQKTLNASFGEIENLKQENQTYKSEIEQKEQKRDELFKMIIAEAEGRSPTNKEGKGPVYREKKAEFDKAETELKQIRQQNRALINSNNERIRELREKRDQQLESEESVYMAKGFLGKMKALSSLASRNSAVRAANIFIILLFIVIESAPMIVKLLSRRGPYDLLLESIEKEKNLQIRKHVDEVQLEYNRDNSLHTGLKNQLYSIKLAREKENLEDAFKVKKELDELKLQKWKDKEMEKLNKEQNVALKSLDDILNNNHKIFSE